jgi:hypothetical protein
MERHDTELGRTGPGTVRTCFERCCSVERNLQQLLVELRVYYTRCVTYMQQHLSPPVLPPAPQMPVTHLLWGVEV